MPDDCRCMADIKCAWGDCPVAGVLCNGTFHLVRRVSEVGIAVARRVHRNIELYFVTSPPAVVEMDFSNGQCRTGMLYVAGTVTHVSGLDHYDLGYFDRKRHGRSAEPLGELLPF
jgi:hypothetical protein